MRKCKILGASIVVVLLQALDVSSGHAQELYKTFLSVTCRSTNESGRLVYRTLTNRDFIRACASEHGLSNLFGLSLVYNRTDDSVQVVSGTNRVALCTPLSFSGGQSLSNTNQTKVERMAFVFEDDSTTANGTLVATERYRFDSSHQITGFNLVGRLQYAVPAEGTHSTAIYTGYLFAGSGLFFGYHDENGDDQDQNFGPN